MERVARFFKVSFEQFSKDIAAASADGIAKAEARLLYNEIKLPQRATAGSAGYDFYLPYAITLRPGESTKIVTGIRARMKEGWVLMAFPKSGLGFKYRLQLDNTVGVIDSDYFGADNEGHIQVCITNDNRAGKVLDLPAGKGFMQGIFMPYGITEDDDADGIRTGGFGSTDK